MPQTQSIGDTVRPSDKVKRAHALITRHVNDRPASEDATSNIPRRVVRILAEPDPAPMVANVSLLADGQAVVRRNRVPRVVPPLPPHRR